MIGGATTCLAARKVLLPGSFDPCHQGHRLIAQAVERQHHRPVAYAITADPVHKPALRVVELLDRIASIRLGGGARPIVLTERDTLFSDKARQSPGAGLALGIDALLRMLVLKRPLAPVTFGSAAPPRRT